MSAKFPPNHNSDFINVWYFWVKCFITELFKLMYDSFCAVVEMHFWKFVRVRSNDIYILENYLNSMHIINKFYLWRIRYRQHTS